MTGIAAAAGARTRSLAVSISAGQGKVGTGLSWTYSANHSVVTGGSGSYTYAWSLAQTNGDTSSWSMTGQGTAFATPTISGISVGELSGADLTVTVTDSVTGAVAGSNTAHYNYVDAR